MPLSPMQMFPIRTGSGTWSDDAYAGAYANALNRTLISQGKSDCLLS